MSGSFQKLKAILIIYRSTWQHKHFLFHTHWGRATAPQAVGGISPHTKFVSGGISLNDELDPELFPFARAISEASFIIYRGWAVDVAESPEFRDGHSVRVYRGG